MDDFKLIHAVAGKHLSYSLRTRVDVTVENLTDRDAIPTSRRRWYMVVGVYDDGSNNGMYVLEKNNEVLGDNDNWKHIDSDLLPDATEGQIAMMGTAAWQAEDTEELPTEELPTEELPFSFEHKDYGLLHFEI